MKRRSFIKSALASSLILPACTREGENSAESEKNEPAFKISLAEWSLNRAIRAKKLSNLDFPAYTKKNFGITAVEYVNQLFGDRTASEKYLKELKSRCGGEGVESVLIMVDGEGHVGMKSSAEREKTLEKHRKWMNAAQFLGCHSIRVNAHGQGASDEEKAANCVQGLSLLAEEAVKYGLNVIVENHGGLSSDGKWMSSVLRDVNLSNCGSLPDFGNFVVSHNPRKEYDRYQGMEDLMPYAKAVSAKSRDFNEAGEETQSDFARIMAIVLKHGYHGHVGIEYEGRRLSEDDGIRATQALLEKICANS